MPKRTAAFIFMMAAMAHIATAAVFCVDARHPAGKVSPMLYGLMTEEINHSYDGGLYAELIQNRAFLDDGKTPVHWSVIGEASAADLALDPAHPLNGSLTTSLRLTIKQADEKNPAGVANDGFWGIPVQPKTSYHASIFAKAAAGFTGPVTVAIVSDDGKVTYATGKFSGLSTNWNRFEVKLKTSRMAPPAKAHFTLTLDRPGTVWLGLVSLFPPTWNDQPNGFRKDLMQLLVDLNPKFLRLPGGNYLEGNTIAERFNWKKTIGPIEQRRGHPGPWGYRSTDGLGLLEFLKWCEDMQAEPVLAVYAGYSLQGEHVPPGPDLQPHVQDALDEIEYVTGCTNTVWGARRAGDGHPAPFHLQYVEIGNEDWFDRAKSYDARFAQFYDAIKAKYPQLKLISTVGNEQSADRRVQSRRPDVLDEHYYRSSHNFLEMAPDYARHYDRNGPGIFVGEWAAYETARPPWENRPEEGAPTPDLKAALGDAAFMAAMERNADLVVMQCYAPLLVNINPGARQWRPNLIGYDAVSAYGSPSYYAIQMFSRNLGDEILPAAAADTAIQGCATRDSQTGEIILKLVNPQPVAAPVNIQIQGVAALASKATAITLSGNPADANSITEPRKVVPIATVIRNVKPDFTYSLPPNSIVVIKLKSR